MSHLYPLAQAALEALEDGRPAFRTRHEAERRAGPAGIICLQTDWISEGELDRDDLAMRIGAGRSQGFVQAYEDEVGQPVYAITYWKLAEPLGEAAPSQPAPERLAAPPQRKTPAVSAPDHTDDLYLRSVRPRKRQRRSASDPRQLDLFMQADARGFEHADPDNRAVIINDEEGDGTVFGG